MGGGQSSNNNPDKAYNSSSKTMGDQGQTEAEKQQIIEDELKDDIEDAANLAFGTLYLLNISNRYQQCNKVIIQPLWNLRFPAKIFQIQIDLVKLMLWSYYILKRTKR